MKICAFFNGTRDPGVEIYQHIYITLDFLMIGRGGDMNSGFDQKNDLNKSFFQIKFEIKREG